ncbi:MAG TPA: haloalkane dehalogenase [Candidatus Dormibacteraeota bacterium]
MDVTRTPHERFAALPDFPFVPRYREWEGLRLAHVDAGSGSTVVLLHGEPTWSFLWRKVMRPLLDAGHRCVAPDLPGFGRSDKPNEAAWYTYDRLCRAFASLFDDLDLRDVTLVVHDWGGPIGLRVAATLRPEHISRIVAMDTGLFTGEQRMSDGWMVFRDFVARTHDLPIGMLVERGCKTPPEREVIAAYEAPFPTPESKTGARRLPMLIPLSPNDPGAAEGREAVRALRGDTRPSLLLWADSDPALPLDPAGRQVQTLLPTAAPLTVIENAGHFLQEDSGERIGSLIVDWLAGDGA